eukprot:9493769-Pyramimonas_sp.AAC.2
MSACVKEAQAGLKEPELDIKIPICLHSSLTQMLHETPDIMQGDLHICFFDDGAFVLLGPALRLVQVVPTVVKLVAASFVRRGLKLNFAEGKTEVLFQLRGRGSRAAKHLLWHDLQGQYHIGSPLLGQFTLKAVRRCSYLGTDPDELASIGPELAHREASIQQSSQQLRRRIFATNHALPRAAALHLTDTLLFSGLLFNAGTWPQLSAAQHAHLQRVMVNKYRQVLSLRHSAEHTECDMYVPARARRATLRMHRLRLLGRLVHYGTHALRGLVAHAYRTTHERNGTSWLHRVFDDMDWLRTVHVQMRDMPSPKDDFARWEQHSLCSLPAWKRALNAAMRAGAKAQARAALAQKASYNFSEMVRTAG